MKLVNALFLILLATPASSEPWALYAELLDRHTLETSDLAQTRVDYAALRRAPDWDRLLTGIEATDPAALQGADSRLAYWINAYNIFAIDLVVKGRPQESIRDLGSFFSPVWKKPAGRIAGRSYTLHEIEHEILRPMGDPRIHGAIVCASSSCPPLARTPYTAAGLEGELRANLERWLRHPNKGVRLDAASNTLHVSKVFKWFEEDFDVQGGVRAFLSGYVEVGSPDVDLEYLDYDWHLNKSTSGDGVYN